jgi:hypothetical protein
MLTPYPLVYCPKGINKPACCPHTARVDLLPGKGPDAVVSVVDNQQVTVGGGGTCWGGGYQPAAPGWKLTRGGWYVQIHGHKPQDLIRLQAHPRVREWTRIPGAQPDQAWQVPVLLEEDANHGWTSAADGIWDGERYDAGDLAPLQEQLMAVLRNITLGLDGPELLAAIRTLAIDLLRVGQWVDEDLLIAGRWLSESVMLSAITSAVRRSGE